MWVTSLADIKSVQGALWCSPAAAVVQWSSRVWSDMCEEGEVGEGKEWVGVRWEGEWVS